MQLIFIYGPPASGKFTIGTELARHTNYRLFHNHLTVPVARLLFPDAHEPHHSEAYSILLKKLRLATIACAAHEDINLIFTFAYSGAVDDNFVDDIVKTVTKNNGTVHFVQLTPPDTTLLERVTEESRKKLGKMTDPAHLKEILALRDMRASVKHSPVLQIDTSSMPATESAQRIMHTFRL